MNIKRISDKAIIPTYGSENAAGMDMYSIDNVTIEPRQTVMVHTGICMEIPSGYYGALYPRSGLATKRGIRLANCVGVIDSDYRGEVIAALYNDSAAPQEIREGDRIAQLIISPYARPDTLNEVDNLSDTDRGAGGFGHTGR